MEKYFKCDYHFKSHFLTIFFSALSCFYWVSIQVQMVNIFKLFLMKDIHRSQYVHIEYKSPEPRGNIQVSQSKRYLFGTIMQYYRLILIQQDFWNKVQGTKN